MTLRPGEPPIGERRLRYRLADRMGYDLIKKSRNRHTFIDRHVALLLDRHRVNCVLDVGANAGQYAKALRDAGYAGRIVSFEPVSASFAALEKACAGDREWRCHRIGLGRRERSETIAVYADHQWSSFLRSNEYARRSYPDASRVIRREEVALRRLDALWGEIVDGLGEPRAFLKMDTQGYDLEVVAGAAGCLDRIQGLQSEASVTATYEDMPDYIESLSEYRRLGFEVTGFYPVFRDRDSLILGEFDVVMFRRA